jgi:signal transduction histidine kinase
MRIKSLTARVVVFATLWAAVALVAIALVISALYRQGAERGFRQLLRAQLYNVINSIEINADLALSGRPQLGDLRFSQPGSGWYWMVEPIKPYAADPLTSSSADQVELPVNSLTDSPFDKRYERFYTVRDPNGNHVEVAETEVEMDEAGHVARFRVAGNRNGLEAEISAFSRNLYLSLVIFGIGSLALNAAAILYGLSPLDEARKALERIRGGDAERLDGEFPYEIQPLASEINALIENNRRVVERARMQVGNLAHSLKTPLAVLINEARVLEAPHGELVKSQAEAMQAQVQSYLNRARIAAQRDTVLARVEAEPVLERLARVMRRLNPDCDFTLSVEPPGLVLAMEQQDLEEIVGNLLENAARFARKRVQIDVSVAPEERVGSDPSRKHWLLVSIADDGPGLEPDQMREAIKRGKRLDETKPGTGLGLSIVTEITSEYQGRFTLQRAELGGLQAELLLPGLPV